MRIAVDARELGGQPTGVGRYLGELLTEWHASPDARRHEWRLFAHAPLPPRLLPEAQTIVLPGTGGTRWEQTTFARALSRDKPDVLFAPGYTAPLTAPCPVALTIHDVSFAAHREWFSPREGIRRRTLTAWSARRARLVLTDSAFSRDEIVEHIGIPPSRIRVIPLGMRRPRVPVTRARQPLVLYVGSIFRRRHIGALIDAFAQFVAPSVEGSRLAIVGDNRLYPPGDPAAPLRQYPPDIAARVAIHSYVDDATLAELYARASVFAFLSEYEGFGLTPLEAMASGVPPLVLDTRVAREVYGDAAVYVQRPLPETVGPALRTLLTDADARTSVLGRAGDVLARYDWSRTATATLRVIEEAAGV